MSTTESPTVQVAIARVMEEMKGVGKDQVNKEQHYRFRGIDDVLTALHPLLAKHGVVFVPNVIEREYEERVSKSGTVGHCAHLHVQYTIYGPAGDYVTGSTWGEGLDYSDKGTNKAMTAAFKYALFQVFAICDPEEDGDRETPESSTDRRASGTVRRAPTQGQAAIEAAFDNRAVSLEEKLANPPTRARSATEKQVKFIRGLAQQLEIQAADLDAILATELGRPVGLDELTVADANVMIDWLKGQVAENAA